MNERCRQERVNLSFMSTAENVDATAEAETAKNEPKSKGDDEDEDEVTDEVTPVTDSPTHNGMSIQSIVPQ